MISLIPFTKPVRRRMTDAFDFPILHFNRVELVAVEHEGNPWIRSADLARALGYEKEKSITNLYNRNADEFTASMTCVIKLMTQTKNTGDLGHQIDDQGQLTETRIFSPRGCHLIAMLARTPVAKAFRRWILDILDALGEGGNLGYSAWRNLADHARSFEHLVFKSGMAFGRLLRYKPERRQLALRVCELRKKGLRLRGIASALGVSIHVVRRLLRLHYREITTGITPDRCMEYLEEMEVPHAALR